MSTHPRNPRYFPRMKVRGKDRRRQASMQRVNAAFDYMKGSFDRFALAVKDATRSIEKLIVKGDR